MHDPGAVALSFMSSYRRAGLFQKQVVERRVDVSIVTVVNYDYGACFKTK